MTLERWSVSRYHMPYLHIHAIRRLSDSLEVDSPRGVFRLSCNSATSLDEDLLPLLDALRDPRNALWDAVRQRSSGTDGLAPMLRELDHFGLIRDRAATNENAAQQEIERSLRAWSSELGSDIAAHGESAALTLRRLTERLSAENGEAQAATMEEQNFFILTLLLQARYLRADAPAILGLLVQGLSAAERRARLGEGDGWWTGIGRMSLLAEQEWCSGTLDLRTLNGYLASTGRLVRDALKPGAERRARSVKTWQDSLSGINFVLDLEGEVTRLLAELGSSAAFSTIQDAALGPSLVRSAFLQEYFVTCRFVECIAPLLSRRFAAPLRDSIHRYFSEEMGHEKFERENCLRLGLTDQQIDAAMPLPLHRAFVDIITSLARESPISFFCSSMFTEGLIGDQDSLMSLAQQAFPEDTTLLHSIDNHVAINEASDHRGVGRDWMSHVPIVPPEMQAETSEIVTYLAELNWRMWDQLARSCVA